ncbi:MAG: MBG domain-containing protein, partial [Eggerthella lenta]
LFVVGADGSEIPLCDPVKGVAEGKPTTVYYDTSKKLLPVGESIVRVRVSGMANLQEAFEDVQVLVKPKVAALSWSGLDDRVYGDGAQVSAQLVGALPTDDVRVDVSGGAETEAGGPYAATASLAGEDAPFYAIEGSAVADYSIAKAPAFDLSGPVDMKRLQPGDEASVDVAALLPEAARDASFEVASFTEEGLVAAEVDAAGILTLTSDAPAGAQRDEVEVRLSNMANCEDSKVVVTVSYVDKPVAKISNATAANDLVYNGSPQVGFAGKPVASFDGGTYEGDFKLSYEGVGDTAYGPSADAPTRAGDYVATLSVPGDEPSCAGSISLGFSIGRAPLAVTAHDATATYGEQGADAGVEFEGFVPGEGPSNLSGSLALAIEGYEAGSPAGFYPIVPSGLSSGDYLISFVPGRLEVLPKVLSAKVDAGDPS